jgi:glycosyltransferase involved in cell wall biosynthesis
MRITCLIDYLVSGGAQRQLCTLAVLLRRQGHDVAVLTYHPDDFFLSMLREAGVEYQCVQAKSKLRRMWALRRALRGGNQDVVLAFLRGGCLYAELAALPRRRWGLVVSERTAVPAGRHARLPWRRWLHRIADYVVTNSHANRLMLERDVPSLQGRVVTIYNAVDLDLFSPGLPNVDRDPGKLRLAVAALYDRHKNMTGLIEAVTLARARLPQCDITVDWHGYEPRRLQESDRLTPLEEARILLRCRDMQGSVRLNADTADVAGLFRRSDAVVLPSFYEGLPNAVCEAMGCGRPVLASRVSDVENLIAEGDNGFLFDPRSPADIADAIVKLTKLSVPDREAMGTRGRRRAEMLFRPETVLAKYTEVLQAAAERRQTPISHWIDSVPATARHALT